MEQILNALKNKRVPTFFYNRTFDFKQFSFCFRNQLSYRIASDSCLNSMLSKARGRTFEQEISASFEEEALAGGFVFEGYNFSKALREEVIGNLTSFLETKVLAEQEYLHLFRKYEPSILLTDEDYALRGGFAAAFARKMDVSVFCISHSATAIDFEVPAALRCLGQSITCVNSEFERDAYAVRGWDPARFELTGLPRYESLGAPGQSSPAPIKLESLRILFCANTFISMADEPDRYGYLGHGVYSTERIVRPSAELIFDVLKSQLQCHMLLKPHSPYGIQEWRDFARAHGLQDRVDFPDPRQSIDHLFCKADLMVVSYWSTSIIEAAIYGLPIIFVDPLRMNRRAVGLLAKAGLCTVVHTREDFLSALQRLSSVGSFNVPGDKKMREYFLGQPAAGATDRIVRKIQERVPVRSTANVS